MPRRQVIFVILLLAVIGVIALFFSLFDVRKAEAPKRVFILTASDLQLNSVEGIKAGLKELGYREGGDIILELFNPKGDMELTKNLAVQMVASRPDLIVSVSTSASRAVKDANQDAKLPVVFVDVGNFEELGIQNIQRPGGFMSGVVVDNVPAAPKRMEILKTLLPGLKTIALLVNNKHVSYDEILKTHEEGAKKLGLKLLWYPVTKKEEVSPAMERLAKDHPDAFMTTSEAVISGNAALIAPVLRQAKIPSIDFNVERGVSSGYLMVYGIARFDVGKQGARIIDKVLKGESPGNIPVEFASQITFEVSEILAKETGLKIPDAILLQANKIYR
ncbi:hypothetical protein A2757_02105 [Candidatus Giovannonibacteria bacterium RIFCSPHIGHO2_01_FULL_48_47]|nr:MAG: hypothetical protein A2757_02105 [Candidatus Giovannonibacteria bacterium RIFCSPHIGHO2_01_FULL_48_47]OGF69104.1 MAG: hypothetical protein A3D61_03965 [Candidatus Giovannonibacteria bacterium RIFCSPHIGHO2_02_FULL_48_15]OGF88781.1 MAG: hypothetical protein A3B26_02890 [Candidatus Giovannonibacteria bacterium RIFCSPLOWO2_01_FULL_48_47]OGF96526.1 MAG: hypothetical protein A2613_03170 [Candidatus Giovannonibacteria bacterium RIFOXYD1_FULL_48_21]HBT81200.1 hypothetical protein [Candidatus Gio